MSEEEELPPVLREALEGMQVMRDVGLALNRAHRRANEGLCEIALLASKHGDQEVADLAVRVARETLALAQEAGP